jgi:hypothetical protein
MGLSLIVMSCGDDAVPTSLVDEGWTFWKDGFYAQAHAKFSEAALSDAEEGLNGLGWTTLKMDSLSQSEIYFVGSAVSGVAGDTLVDAMVGLAMVAWQQGDYAISLQAANYVLRTEPNYIFEHDPSITKDDIILAKAYDQYHLLQYAGCITTIQQLDAAFTANVSDPVIAQILINKLNLLSGTGS